MFQMLLARSCLLRKKQSPIDSPSNPSLFCNKPICALHGQKNRAKDNNVYDREFVQIPEPLQRLRGFEMAARDLNPIRFQFLEKGRGEHQLLGSYHGCRAHRCAP